MDLPAYVIERNWLGMTPRNSCNVFSNVGLTEVLFPCLTFGFRVTAWL